MLMLMVKEGGKGICRTGNKGGKTVRTQGDFGREQGPF